MKRKYARLTPVALKRALIITMMLLTSLHAWSQNEVAIGSATTKSNAILWLNGNGSQGLILPVVTNKSTVSNPDKGMIVYDDSDNKVWYRSGSAWVEVGGAGSSSASLTLATQGNLLQLKDGPNILSSVGLASGVQSAGAFMVFTGGQWQFASLSGDVSGPNGSLQVGGLKGKSIANLPGSLQGLAYDPSANSGNGGWVFQSSAAGGTVTNVTGTAPVTVTNGTTTPVISLAAAGITNALLGNNAVTSAKIQDASITAADLADGSVGGGTGGVITDASITNADIATSAAIAVTKIAGGSNGQVLTTAGGLPTWTAPLASTDAQDLALTGTTLSLTNDATPVTLGGLAILNSITSAEITNNTIANGDIAPAAAIAVTKLANGTNGEVLTTVGGIPTWQTPAASTDAQDLALTGTTLSLTNDATPVTLGALAILNSITSAEITNNTIANGDIAPAAAIAVTKLANGTNGEVLTTVGGIPTWQTPAVSTDAQDLNLTGTTLSLTNDATPVTLGALAILGSVTSAQITNNTIVNADIAPAAAIAVTKIANGSDGQVLTTVAGVPAWQAPTLSTDNQDLTLTGTTLNLTNDGTPVALGGLSILNSVTTTEITNGTIVDIDISASANIAATKLANTVVLDTESPNVAGDISGNFSTGLQVKADVITTDEIADGSVFGADLATDIIISTTGNIEVTGSGVFTGSGSLILDLNASHINAGTMDPSFIAAGSNGQVLTVVAGTPSWQAAGAGSGWLLSGNAGTTDGKLLNLPATGDFIGTTDATALNFRVNSIEAGRISPDDEGGTYFGLYAGERELTTGPNPNPRYNTAFGNRSLWKLTTGQNNTAMGQAALRENNASNNTAVGQGALANSTTGNNNTAFGSLTLIGNLTGGGNTAIGSAADVSASNLVNATAIGFATTVNASNKVRIGNASVTVIEGQVAWTNPSDIRLKKDILDLDAGLSFIKQLRPVSYRMKSGDTRLNWGFVAQEVEVLVGTENAVLSVGEDTDRTLGLRYSDFVAPLVKSSQELSEQVEALQAENEKLMAALEAMKKDNQQLHDSNQSMESRVSDMKNDLEEIKRVLNLSASKTR
jgi:hypothetical protein